MSLDLQHLLVLHNEKRGFLFNSELILWFFTSFKCRFEPVWIKGRVVGIEHGVTSLSSMNLTQEPSRPSCQDTSVYSFLDIIFKTLPAQVKTPYTNTSTSALETCYFLLYIYPDCSHVYSSCPQKSDLEDLQSDSLRNYADYACTSLLSRLCLLTGGKTEKRRMNCLFNFFFSHFLHCISKIGQIISWVFWCQLQSSNSLKHTEFLIFFLLNEVISSKLNNLLYWRQIKTSS